MMNNSNVKYILMFAGLTAMLVGFGMLLFPIEMYAISGVYIIKQVNLLNEIRAPGGALVLIGAVIYSGANIKTLTLTSFILAIALYLGFGVARLYSNIVDGISNNTLLFIASFEFLIGLACLIIFIRFFDNNSVKIFKR